jgi:hypoxanthine phosphoribosyltransferase
MERQQAKIRPAKVLITESRLSSQIEELARKIKAKYESAPDVVVFVLLEGAKKFACELFARINDEKFQLRYIRAKSYNGTKANSCVEITGDIGDITGREVLIVDDIYDSGITMSSVIRLIEQTCPKRIKTCVMLEKQTTRKETVHIDFQAAQVPDCFVVGYGLDYDGRFRDLPYVAAVEEIES